MAEITAALVKDLRVKTGAGMMDCKKALTENAGDVEAAVDWLRTKGLAAAAKKAGRVAAEGLVGVCIEGKRGALVEINSETDFLARNEAFQEFVRNAAALSLGANGDVDALRASHYPNGGGQSLAEALTALIAKVGENMSARRTASLEVASGVVAAYVHNQVSSEVPEQGKIGVIVALESTGDTEKLLAFGRQLAMHISWSAPQAIDVADVDPAMLERERHILTEQARESGKPENIIEKMLEGRLRKYYEEICLLEQTFVIDGETKVRKVLEQIGQDVGAPVKIAGFHRFQLGEGVQRDEGDFAAEVAAQLGR
ncbi:MAG: translation elongation factor Ts [Alphaproteobacteria bacterium]